MDELSFRKFDVLVVDDEEDNLDAFRFSFRKSFSLSYALGGAPALEMLETLDAAVIVADQRMPNMPGIEFLRRAKERRPDAVGILLTAYADLPVLIEAVNSGAVDRYLQKPWNSKELTIVLRQAITTFATMRENRRLREQLSHYAGYLEREQRDPFDFGELIAESQEMQRVGRLIEEVSLSDTPVLLVAEPGSEQEIVARAIHVGSPREARPFVRVTCSAFRGEALERELFGWRKGAFEAAYSDRAGRVEVAHGGTLFLDGLTDPSPGLQARLLRLLAEGNAERVGSTDSTFVDVRLVVSMPSPLARGGSVVDELVDRLSVMPIELPPLRQRKPDLVPLAEHFLRKYASRNARAATRFNGEALEKIAQYDFPGNSRELQNAVERAAILARGEEILPEHVLLEPPREAAPPPTVDGAEADADANASSAPTGSDAEPAQPRRALPTRLEEMERRELLSALERCGGNKAEVARSLGIQRTTLYYRLKRLGIET